MFAGSHDIAGGGALSVEDGRRSRLNAGSRIQRGRGRLGGDHRRPRKIYEDDESKKSDECGLCVCVCVCVCEIGCDCCPHPFRRLLRERSTWTGFRRLLRPAYSSRSSERRESWATKDKLRRLRRPPLPPPPQRPAEAAPEEVRPNRATPVLAWGWRGERRRAFRRETSWAPRERWRRIRRRRDNAAASASTMMMMPG